MIFEVTTTETVYETYTVEASSHAEARQLVLDGEIRWTLESRSAGSGDDMHIISTKVIER